MLGPQFKFTEHPPSMGGPSFTQYRVSAVVGERQVGTMSWSGKRGIHNVEVAPEYQRQGIATGMWNEGHRMAEASARVPKPRHSSDRTKAGDAWARKVGGPVPRRKQ